MKAFMSDRTARAEYQRAFGPEYLPWPEATEEWMREADFEARCILAEAKEDGPCETARPNGDDGRTYRIAAEADLAEFLREFIDAPIPE